MICEEGRQEISDGMKYEVDVIHKIMEMRIGIRKEMEPPSWLENREDTWVDKLRGLGRIILCILSMFLANCVGGLIFVFFPGQIQEDYRIIMISVYVFMFIAMIVDYVKEDTDIDYCELLWAPWVQVGFSLLANYVVHLLMEKGWQVVTSEHSGFGLLWDLFVNFILILYAPLPIIPVSVCIASIFFGARITEKIDECIHREQKRVYREQEEFRDHYLKEYKAQEKIHEKHEWVDQRLVLIKERTLLHGIVAAYEYYEMDDYEDALLWVRKVLEQYLYYRLDKDSVLVEEKAEIACILD